MIAVIALVVGLLFWRWFIVLGAVVFGEVGLSPPAAGFEARSALVGAGYTTSESETVVQHPAARRMASMLVVIGYFGPTSMLALLGVSFVIPTDDPLAERALLLVALLVLLFVIDRLGVIRSLGVRPARAIAKRMVASTTLETWIVVGDHAIAAFIVPPGSPPADATLAAPGVRVLAVEPPASRSARFPTESEVVETQPGDRVIVFGPQEALAPLRSVS